jgi:hypothetical protein
MKITEWVRNYPDFLSKVITGDVSWIYRYDPETKQQSSQWNWPSDESVASEKHVKLILICFFVIDRIICKESIPPSQTVNAKFYCDILRWKQPDKWRTNNWVLHHDKAPAHTALAVQQFLASKNTTVFPHPVTCLI